VRRGGCSISGSQAPSIANPMARVDPGRALDLLGLGLLVAALIWTYVSGWVQGGQPDRVAELLVITAVAYVCGRVAASRSRLAVPGVVALLIAIAAVGFASDLMSRGPLRGPLGYTNAGAALYLQGAVASLMVFAGAKPGLRAAALAAALAFSLATMLTGSQATNALLALPLVAMLGDSRRAAKKIILVFLALFLMALASTIVVGATHSQRASAEGITGVIDATLSSRRGALWHDAVVLMADNPIVGVGPGRFRYESPVARSDRDAAWAHNGFLQQAAEGGLPALVLAVSIVVWGFVRLLLARQARLASLGAASLAALGIQACIDYLLHFPVLPLVVAALVGTAAGTNPSLSDRQVEHR
jgi:O-antigen ligase